MANAIPVSPDSAVCCMNANNGTRVRLAGQFTKTAAGNYGRFPNLERSHCTFGPCSSYF